MRERRMSSVVPSLVPPAPPLPCHRVILIGPRGSGKSTVARLLSDQLGWAWLDADVLLEQRAGQSIRALFASEGEAGFRQREADVLRDLARLEHHVVATGGGVVLREDNRALLRSPGSAVVWLSASVDTLWMRISADAVTADRRPALGVGGREEVAQVVASRDPLYRACADLIVDTTGRAPEEVAALILAWLRNT